MTEKRNSRVVVILDSENALRIASHDPNIDIVVLDQRVSPARLYSLKETVAEAQIDDLLVTSPEGNEYLRDMDVQERRASFRIVKD